MGGPNKSDEGEKISKPNKRSGTSVGHLRVSKVSPESSLQFEFHLNNSGVKHITRSLNKHPINMTWKLLTRVNTDA